MEQFYYLGYTKNETKLGQVNLETLREDDRLIIVSDFFIFTTESFLQELKSEYSIEASKTIVEWFEEDYDFESTYHDYVENGFEYSLGSILNEDEIKLKTTLKLESLDIKELRDSKIEDLIVKIASEMLISELENQIQKLKNV